MLEQLKEKVLQANLELVNKGLVLFTWGNVSAIDRESGLVVIKPSGVEYANMKASDMVVVDLDGNVVDGDLNPSSDTPTHLELYKSFKEIGGVTHTHSTFATSWAQSGQGIPFYGTTHADYFYGEVPCTRDLTEEEVKSEYEKNTGKVIIERFEGLNPIEVPGVLVKSHGVFTFGKDASGSVFNAVVIEEVAKMAYITKTLNPNITPAKSYVLEKHYLRKHGKNAYYGQKRK